MQAVKPKGSKIEIWPTKALWERGYRYRKNHKKNQETRHCFYGKTQSSVTVSFGTVKTGKKESTTLKTTVTFWLPKSERNIYRDKEVNQ